MTERTENPCDGDAWETLRIERHILSTEALCAAAQECSRPTLKDWFQLSTVVPKEQLVIQGKQASSSKHYRAMSPFSTT